MEGLSYRVMQALAFNQEGELGVGGRIVEKGLVFHTRVRSRQTWQILSSPSTYVYQKTEKEEEREPEERKRELVETMFCLRGVE